MVIVTLKKLHTEGRLSIGDTMHSSEVGDCELIAVLDDKRVLVKDAYSKYHTWTIDFGPDTRIVPVNR